MKKILVSHSRKDMISSAADRFITLANAAIRDRGHFSVALSGGSTPEPLYELLAGPGGDSLDWAKVHIFWGDERFVLPDHPDSNFNQANKILLTPRSIKEKNVHRVKTELPPAEAAHMYQEKILSFFKDEIPRFDLILLGMGSDGHTASIFPGSELANTDLPIDCLVSANWVSKLNTWRISFTHHLINGAHNVFFLVSGKDKAKTLKQVLEGPANLEDLPSQLINPNHGDLLWFIDRDAAADLTGIE